MRIIAKKKLRDFWKKNSDAEQPLLAWHREVEKEDWSTPADLKRKYPKARIIGDNRAIFNIRDNRFRLIVRINYQYRVIYIRFVGTHKEYDRINEQEA